MELHDLIDELEDARKGADQERMKEIDEEIDATREQILNLTGGPVAVEPAFR